MDLPALGEIAAVRYKRNPTVDSDPALTPCLFLGRVLRHEEIGGFTASLMSYDNPAEETYLDWDEAKQSWVDLNFGQPVEWVRFPATADTQAYLAELESLPPHLDAGEEIRPLDELRLRFLSAGLESGWFEDLQEPAVYYSDDFPDPAAPVAHWHRQVLGKFEVSAGHVVFDWPVEGRDESEWALTFEQGEDGLFTARSEAFGDEFEARLEQRDGYYALIGMWQGEDFINFFGVVLPRP